MMAMSVRYGVADMNLKISNVTPRDAFSYVLITAADEFNEILFELSHEQADRLEEELSEANRRRREHGLSAAPSAFETREREHGQEPDPVSH